MIGTLVGRYRVLERLGSGGSGTVWKAEDSLLGRPVALKLLHPEAFGAGGERERFVRGARAASLLNHPAIATIYDAGEIDGRFYVASQLVEGMTLAQVLKTRRPELDEACRWIRDVALALSEAHSRGIQHRDISSRNIMVNETGRIYLVDFGLAHQSGTTRPSGAIQSSGTYGYSAPEVLTGKPSDHRADIYSLGVVLYELLTGQRPLSGGRDEALLYKTIYENPLPASSLQPDLPHDLNALVARMLAKNPEERPGSAMDVAEALRPFASPEDPGHFAGTAAARGAARMPFRRLLPRRSGAWIAIGLMAVLAAGATGLKLMRDRSHGALPIGVSPRIAVLPIEPVPTPEASSGPLGDVLAEHLAERLARPGTLRLIPWLTSSTVPRGTSTQEAAARLGADVLVTGTLSEHPDQILLELNLVQGGSGAILWKQKIRGGSTNLPALFREAGSELARGLMGRVPRRIEALAQRPPTSSQPALLAYLDGMATLAGPSTEDRDASLGHFLRASALDTTFVGAHVRAATLLIDTYFESSGRDLEALNSAERLLASAVQGDPGSAAPRRGLIRVAFEKAEYARCLALARSVDSLQLTDVDNLLAAAEGRVYGGDARAGLRILDTILETDPANAPAAWSRVMAYHTLGDPAATLRAGSEYLERHGPDPQILAFMSLAHATRGELEEARARAEDSVDLQATGANLGTTLHLSCLYGRLDRPEEAIRAARFVADVAGVEPAADGRGPRATAAHVAALALLGDMREALNQFAVLRRWTLQTGQATPLLTDVLWTLAAAGESSLALEYLAELLEAGLWSPHLEHSLAPGCDRELRSDREFRRLIQQARVHVVETPAN
jgi:TolB-like protein